MSLIAAVMERGGENNSMKIFVVLDKPNNVFFLSCECSVSLKSAYRKK